MRLVTRSDFDGLICGMWFDHHASEDDRIGWSQGIPGESRFAPSAARIIYEYYGGEKRFSHYYDMINAVDKMDSGNLTSEDIFNPQGWVLLGFISDPRTGLGRFREFRISNYQLMENLVNHCRNMSIDEILQQPDVLERIQLYQEQTNLFIELIKRYTKLDENVIVTDLRGIETIYTGNRFLIYSLFPQQNVSVWIVDGKQKQNVAIACGYSVLNRTCQVDIGKLMLEYGGGGHRMVGTCQVPYERAETIIGQIIERLKG
ncbi:MAG: hypothetical protein AWM53_01018 [Candidatus Dichloromethanomonas elyunquensis]|nr:MAG: hypothetical protein AWM53_01018 [Candidatus Dichloromethanomonas elyunquensis]